VVRYRVRSEEFLRSLTLRVRLLGVLRAGGFAALPMLVLVLLVEALLPAAYAATLGYLVDGVDRASATQEWGPATMPLIAFAGVLVSAELAAATTTGFMTLVGSRVDSANRLAVTSVITRADVPLLGQQLVQTFIRDALADRSKGYDSTLGDGALALLRSVTSIVGLAAACVVLMTLYWWLPVVVLVPALVTRIVRTRQDTSLMHAWRSATGNELAVDVWREANVSPAEGKDIRIFGLATGWSTGCVPTSGTRTSRCGPGSTATSGGCGGRRRSCWAAFSRCF
jgi:ATP-binding cassette subfamily B protein